MDPITGFTNRFYIKKDTQKYLKEEFFTKFDFIKYNSNNYFEFGFDYKNFNNKAGGRTDWVVCSHGDKRSYYMRKIGTQTCNVTENLAELFNKYNISFDDGSCIKQQILSVDSVSFFKTLILNFKLIVQLRHTFNENGQEIDCIISPVAKTGNFFDSRTAKENQPKDADANGAYHIALKGLMTLGRIQPDGKIKKHKENETNKDWLDFVKKIKS